MKTVLLLLAFALAGPAMVLAALANPAPGDLRFVLHPPWLDAADLVENAGGDVFGPERSLIGVFAVPNSADFDQKARRSGAWLLLDGRRLAQICGYAL